jgi:hypothetical protein
MSLLLRESLRLSRTILEVFARLVPDDLQWDEVKSSLLSAR